MLEDHFENFPTFSDFFQRLLKISEDFRQFPKVLKIHVIKKCWKVILSNLRQISKIFQRFLKTSEEFRRFLMTSEDFIKNLGNAGRSSCEHFATFSDFFRRLPKISKDFQRFSKIFKISETCRNVCFCTLQCFS